MENTPVSLPKLRRQIELLLPPRTAFLLVISDMYGPAVPKLATNIDEDDAFEVLRILLREKDIADAVENNGSG